MAKNPTTKAGVIEPPKMSRGGRRVQVDPDAYAIIRDGLSSGGWLTDGEEYESRPAAAAQANRFKKALCNDDETSYEVPKDVKSRVWNNTDHADDSDDARFVFALHDPKAASDDDGDSSE